MKLSVIGASRGIGRKVVEESLERGHTVTAMSRSASQTFTDAPEALTVLDGDATDPADVARATEGVEAVILTLGVPKDMRVLKPTTLFSDATRVLIAAMEAADIKRLLTVTGFGAGDSAEKLSTPERLTQKALLGRAYADKDLQEKLIRDSTLDWTIARPGILSDNRKSNAYKVLVEKETWRNGLINRADVADFLVTAAEEGSHIHQTPALQR
ncbi:NAD(P)-dependent oxidoreductase [Gymnodinialimonas ceratoperidinii]|uniref:SDR family oxidoreductase n=1 Tax=Gymnodinialimonas ceratoperidinii TaxID=2856823 RepID=A0A8F6YAS3_9RHOB|nr:NAD(P)-binding oxidoreductase [Gymnodinialimonas ceratoperidinii]QXT39833.1 SDR family oxidoreductase [Gymnodinialimonas ceratoperidinii]